MALLQRKTRCTVHDGHGGTCGRKDQCTRVVTQSGTGEILTDHQVCKRHRTEMDLPEWDCGFTPSGMHRLLN